MGLLLAASVGAPFPIDRQHWQWARPGLILSLVGFLASLGYLLGGMTILAWLALGFIFILTLWLERILTFGQNRLTQWGLRMLLALGIGTLVVVWIQIESRFSDEEFFAAVEILLLSGFWLFLLILWRAFWLTPVAPPRAGLRLIIHQRWLSLALVLSGGLGLGGTAYLYQHSFYPAQVPPYQEISATQPFLCGNSASDAETAETFDGRTVFQGLLERVEANPLKSTPEFGMLALATSDPRWAQSFHKSILNEAEQKRFTGPANSVKYGQYQAALRAYYYPRMQRAFPSLFTLAEDQKLHEWFAAINHRALTVEWVDGMYALALGKWPEGPYENQENGAGLLALLQVEGLASPDLAALNESYLKRNPRGWLARFRNTDDALAYQLAWINNAFFQSLYTRNISAENRRHSFEWLLLQALPDGAPLGYNYPNPVSLAGSAYLGAQLLNDPHSLWLAGKALAYLQSSNGYLFAQPGVEKPLELMGQAPTQSSCLLYGNSGMPDQNGPLAPDKIVFRDGWSNSDRYLLVNLRFTGWHRYKATNTLTLFYRGRPLIEEEQTGQPFKWLPVGRSLFRDKRIPRENLNGLVVERTGMSAVLYTLIGMGGFWEQDPPYYARVEQFEPGRQFDLSRIVLSNWHGWTQTRTIYFYHAEGPIIVVDEAQGPGDRQAAITWQVTGQESGQANRFQLPGAYPAEMVLLSGEASQIRSEKQTEDASSSKMSLMVYPTGKQDHLQLVTIFFTGTWVGAEAHFTSHLDGTTLEIIHGTEPLSIPLWNLK